jgi:hypothetical protein
MYKDAWEGSYPGVFVFAAFSSHWQLSVGLYETLFCQIEFEAKNIVMLSGSHETAERSSWRCF